MFLIWGNCQKPTTRKEIAEEKKGGDELKGVLNETDIAIGNRIVQCLGVDDGCYKSKYNAQ